MRIRSCLYRQLNRLQHLMNESRTSRDHQGQVLVIFGVALVVLLLFVGLAVDAGAVYVTYGQLKRAVDAAAVAAANDFKRGETVDRMKSAAEEVLYLHNVNVEELELDVFICDNDGDGIRDADLATTVPQFFARCPNTESPANESPRKLVWVEADLEAPLYFLHLLGFENINLSTNAIAEAAPIDLVIVLDVSESMASDTIDTLLPSYPDIIDNYDPNGSDPPGCNNDNSCQPLLDAKNAAKALIDTLYDGYDQVALVTFDQVAVQRFNLGQDSNPGDATSHLEEAKDVIDNQIKLHDDPPFAKIWQTWKGTPSGGNVAFNPANPEDRDGDGLDTDPNLPTCDDDPFHPHCCTLDEDRWDDTKDPFGWGGLPCDDDHLLDSYDWDGDGIFTQADHDAAALYLQTRDPDGAGGLGITLSPLSTCTGCGMRSAANILKAGGRPNAVWVIVFLSDGVVNLSDKLGTLGGIPAEYPNGFCTGQMDSDPYKMNFWRTACLDMDISQRYCIDDSSTTCPPDTTWDGSAPNLQYSVYDYALDMVDMTALTKSLNINEDPGNDIAIYSIGLGAAGNEIGGTAIGEKLLRYMAAVGDDGDRETDPCQGVGNKQSCGQYYYAPSGNALLPIFEDIASRIYTRITD